VNKLKTRSGEMEDGNKRQMKNTLYETGTGENLVYKSEFYQEEINQVQDTPYVSRYILNYLYLL